MAGVVWNRNPPAPMFPRRLLVFSLMLLCIHGLRTEGFAQAQGAAADRERVADEDAPAVDSPEIAADRKVTFRFDAPGADAVKLKGIKRTLVDLKRSHKGIWSVTVGPLDPGIYEYSFIVDGEPSIDPANPFVKPDISPDSSALEITSDTPLFYQWKDVPHGTIHLHEYFSPSLKRLRRLRIYTPPGYETHQGQRYPALYLFHGTGDTEATWTEFGHAHLILDNLLAEGKAMPMILVMPDGHADLQEEEGIHKANFVKFGKDVLESVMPLVDEEYRTVAEAGGRAICGLSMGGMQSLEIGLNHSNLFAWVGGMSAYVPAPEELIAKGLADPQLNQNLKLLWSAIGDDDYLLEPTKEFNALLKKHDIRHKLVITAGTHEWTVWRGYLRDFAPLLFRDPESAGPDPK